MIFPSRERGGSEADGVSPSLDYVWGIIEGLGLEVVEQKYCIYDK